MKISSRNAVMSTNIRRKIERRYLFKSVLDCTFWNGVSSCSINNDTVRQRLKRKTKTSIQGLKSPQHGIKLYVVSLVIQLANMHVTIAQGLQLCNSIIRGDTVQKAYVRVSRKFPPVRNNQPWLWILERFFDVKHTSISSKEISKV
jgi:hypothetical protein